MRHAHSPDEHVGTDDLVTAAKVLALAIVSWTGSGSRP
jgi:acetylornithine deacetylase/succinyl-diaminopimelate desuccinylase-like protein